MSILMGLIFYVAFLHRALAMLPSNYATAPSLGPNREEVGLSQIYKEIAKRTNEMEHWPDDANAKFLFPKDSNGAYQIPSFPEQDAPLAVVAIVDRNEAGSQIMKQCGEIFEAFCQELKEILASNGDRDIQKIEADLERYILRTPQGTHHSTVAVFQENPALLLDETEKKKYSRVDEAIAEKLYLDIARHQEQNICSPQLVLDSILLTPDGAMIAGFVDVSSACNYQQIRVSSIEMAEKTIGQLTSRPKKLIHVTAGRVLSLPVGLTVAQRKAVTELVQWYNSVVLPAKVKSMLESPDGASWTLTEISMIRDIVWTLRKIKEYGSWHLQPFTS